MRKEEIFKYVKETFDSDPEYLWKNDPNSAVLRNNKNKKWFAIIMYVLKEKLGLKGSGKVEIINLKCDPILIGSLIGRKGFLPAYHMNKEYWISVILNDKNIPNDELLDLINLSYELVNKK